MQAITSFRFKLKMSFDNDDRRNIVEFSNIRCNFMYFVVVLFLEYNRQPVTLYTEVINEIEAFEIEIFYSISVCLFVLNI